MKRILKIKSSGLLIKLPGLTERRTPLEIDITKQNINNVILELNKQGIEDFEILNTSFNDKKNIKSNVNIKNKKENTKLDLKEIHDRFDEIERLLNLILNNKSLVSYNNNLEQKNNIDEPQTTKDFDEDFIPSINLDGLKINK